MFSWRDILAYNKVDVAWDPRNEEPDRDLGTLDGHKVFCVIYDRTDGKVLWGGTYGYCNARGWDHTKIIPHQLFAGFEEEKYGLCLLESTLMSQCFFCTGQGSGYRVYEDTMIRRFVFQQVGLL